MCGSDGIWRGNYFGGEPTGRAEVELRVGKLKSGKAAGKDDITGEMIKDRCMEIYKDGKRKDKRCIYQSKKEVSEQFGRKMNQNLDGNRKLCLKEVSMVNGGKLENCSRI